MTDIPSGTPQAAPAATTTAQTGDAAAPVSDAPDLGEYGDFVALAKKNGYKASDLMRAFGPSDADTKGETKQDQPAFDPAKFEADLFKKWKREQALGEHKGSYTKYQQSVQAMIDEFRKNEEFSDPLKELLADAAQGRISRMELESLYDKDHPLHSDHLRPLDESKLGETKKEILARVEALKAGLFAKIGDTSRKSKPAAPAAGNSTPQGGKAPTDEPRGTNLNRSDLKDFFKNERAKFNGASVSSIAGA